MKIQHQVIMTRAYFDDEIARSFTIYTHNALKCKKKCNLINKINVFFKSITEWPQMDFKTSEEKKDGFYSLKK